MIKILSVLLISLSFFVVESRGDVEKKKDRLRRGGHSLSYSSLSPSSSSLFPSKTVQLIPNSGFHPFVFGPQGSFSNEFVVYNPMNPIYLIVTDCYCGGDQFNLHLNSSTTIPITTGCDGSTATCDVYEEDPFMCMLGLGFCKESVVLTAGFNYLTFEVVRSYFKAGIGFVWTDEACLDSDSNEVPCCVLDFPSTCDWSIAN